MREVAKLNPDLQGVLDIKDYNERRGGQRTLDDDPMAALIEILGRHELGLKNTELDILGRGYEYLLRKFAEGQGQSAGESYTLRFHYHPSPSSALSSLYCERCRRRWRPGSR
jgi:type I restriction enzyme M protein